MVQSVDQEKLEIEGMQSELDLFLKLKDISNNIIFIHPTTSLFFDKLTMFRFVHNEILISSKKKIDSVKNIIVNRISPQKFEIFKTNSLNFEFIIDQKRLEFKCVSPEFGLIWILQDINSLSVGIALGLLEFCDIKKLSKYQNLLSSANELNLILELGEIVLNRFDLIWQIIEKYNYKNELNDFPLFLDRNIRTERRYDKIL